MKITKFSHSCLLVEMPEMGGRTVLFDPGIWSIVPVEELTRLDDIFITHGHSDHADIGLMQRLVARFPQVRILAPPEVVQQLAVAGIVATSDAPEGARLFESPHEALEPLGVAPQEHGIHYLERLSHPGDSHHFAETMPILALPVTAPWGSMMSAAQVAIDLKPKYVIPVHDWHWRSEARKQAYDTLENFLGQHDIVFIKAIDGEPFVLDV